MDLNRLKEPFPREEVEWRAQTVTKDGTKALALAYIDARSVSDRLDAVCGPDRWQCRYTFSPDGKKTLCEIGIRCGEEWIWKADGAGDTDVEAEKGALSDAFKRAGVKWGIARYLYDLPSVWVPCESADFGGKKQFRKFTADPWTFLPGDIARPARPSSTPKPAQPTAAPPDDWKAQKDMLQRHWAKTARPASEFLPWASDKLGREVAALRPETVQVADLRTLLHALAEEAP
jgi:hypothetical protein